MDTLEVLKKVIPILDSISVPVGLAEEITVPILKANRELKLLHNELLEKEKSDNGDG